MVDGEEGGVLAAVDGRGVAWAGLESEVEHGLVGLDSRLRVASGREYFFFLFRRLKKHEGLFGDGHSLALACYLWRCCVTATVLSD